MNVEMIAPFFSGRGGGGAGGQHDMIWVTDDKNWRRQRSFHQVDRLVFSGSSRATGGQEKLVWDKSKTFKDGLKKLNFILALLNEAFPRRKIYQKSLNIGLDSENKSILLHA